MGIKRKKKDKEGKKAMKALTCLKIYILLFEGAAEHVQRPVLKKAERTVPLVHGPLIHVATNDFHTFLGNTPTAESHVTKLRSLRRTTKPRRKWETSAI